MDIEIKWLLWISGRLSPPSKFHSAMSACISVLDNQALKVQATWRYLTSHDKFRKSQWCNVRNSEQILKNPTTECWGDFSLVWRLKFLFWKCHLQFFILLNISRDESTLCRIHKQRISSKTEATLLLVDLQYLYYKSFISAKKWAIFNNRLGVP